LKPGGNVDLRSDPVAFLNICPSHNPFFVIANQHETPYTYSSTHKKLRRKKFGVNEI
jgi:hypothetical protein